MDVGAAVIEHGDCDADEAGFGNDDDALAGGCAGVAGVGGDVGVAAGAGVVAGEGVDAGGGMRALGGL